MYLRLVRMATIISDMDDDDGLLNDDAVLAFVDDTRRRIDEFTSFPSETFETIIGGVLATSSTDSQGEQFSPQALQKMVEQHTELTRFADVPELWLDNNRTERGIRGPVVGRRNHFGSKSRRGTEVAAILYSLVETAKVRGVDPAKYIVDAVTAARLGEISLP